MHLKRNQKGFTLLELMFVLMIMGFFIAMMVPRLGSILGTAVDNTCDTNNKDARYWLSCFKQEKGRLPAGLINIVSTNDAAAVGGEGLPSFDDQDPANGAEVLAFEFVDRNKPYRHVLSADEATELRSMGLSSVVMLNDYAADTPPAAAGQPMMKSTIVGGRAVMMIGAGNDGTNWATGATGSTNYAGYVDSSAFHRTGEAITEHTIPYSAGHGNPYFIYRIAFGIGPDSELVTEGFVQRAALCPGGIQNADNVTYNYYSIIMPRLQSTIDSLGATEPRLIAVGDAASAGAFTAGQQKYWNLGYDSADDVPAANWGTANANAATASGGTWNANTPQQFAGNGHGAQEPWEFDATCPEGHKWPDNEEEMWAVGGDV